MASTPKKKNNSKTTGATANRKKNKPSRRKTSSKKSVKKTGFSLWKFLFKISLLLGIIVTILLSYYMWQLDKIVRAQFEGDKWTLPTHVYSRPTELFAGVNQTDQQLLSTIQQLGYTKQAILNRTGSYQLSQSDNSSTLSIHLRELNTPSVKQSPNIVNIVFQNNRISKIVDANGANVAKIYLEPQLIGTLGENRQEDRKIIRIEDVPKTFITTLLMTEDQDFYEHFGISPKGIARAMISNIKQGRMAQGGSTITQQLVKNFYLTSERKLKRKIKEALMAILLEIHYSKDEILETYINEIYLGQAGNRAIHGFNLASYFYFNRPMNELTLDQFATIVGLVKGPSLYNPIRKPENAIKRRDVVISLLETNKLITPDQSDILKAQPLKISENSNFRKNEAYPAFMDYVIEDINQKLGRYTNGENDIISQLQGMEIYSTLDIFTQKAAEKALTESLAEIEDSKGIEPGSLQGSIIVSHIDSGEIIAITSDRNPRYAGYNRAIHAERQIGSLLKPIIYLTALDSKKYTLASIIKDDPIIINLPNGTVWSPNNYDRKNLDHVLLIDALAKSRNTPAVRVGMNVGLDKIINNAHNMGLESNIPSYPSILLGSSEHTPYEVTQMYQTLANGGLRSNLYGAHYIRDNNSVIQWNNQPKLTRVIGENSSFLTNFAMQAVVNNGTAGSLRRTFNRSRIIAGKTGTTNELKDSWFVGYSGNKLAVVWIGRDDNKTTSLTGASGALKVWEKLFSQIGTSAWPQPKPPRISYLDINKDNGSMAPKGCDKVVNLPFASGTEPAFEPCNSLARIRLNNAENINEANQLEFNTNESSSQTEEEESSNIADWLRDLF